MINLHRLASPGNEGAGITSASRRVAIAFAVISALLAWVAAYWGVPSGALALSCALCSSIAVSPWRRPKSVGFSCLACVLLAALVTYYWHQAWSPDAPI